jgi:hypothetical protein
MGTETYLINLKRIGVYDVAATLDIDRDLGSPIEVGNVWARSINSLVDVLVGRPRVRGYPLAIWSALSRSPCLPRHRPGTQSPAVPPTKQSP